MNESNEIQSLILINGLYIKINNISELIQLEFCIYDLLKKQVSNETSIYIFPIQYFNSNIEKQKEILEISMKESQIDFSYKNEYKNLNETTKIFNDLIENKFINNNINIGIIYQNENLLDLIKKHKENKKIKFYNIFEIYQNFYNKSNKENLLSMLNSLHLKISKDDDKFICKFELNIMVRIINKMVKDGKKFNLNDKNEINENLNKNIHIDYENSEYEKIENYINENNIFYLLFKNFPSYINKNDILNLLYLYTISENDICISYDFFGRKTGKVYLRIFNYVIFREIYTNFNFYYFNDKFIIEVFESNSREFNSCLKSEIFAENNYFYNKNLQNKIFVKISKILSNIKENDINNFLQNYNICQNGIVFNLNKNEINNSECVVAFLNESEKEDAIQRENGRLLKSQTIFIEKSNLDEFEKFSNSYSFQNWMKIISEFISPDDVTRALFINGFPLDVKIREILEYLKIFNINDSDLIIDERILKENGSLICKFYDEEIANQAKKFILNNNIEKKGRIKKIYAENLLEVVNKQNSSL